MKRDTRINFRVTPEIKKVVIKLSKEYNVTVSGFLNAMVTDILIHNKSSPRLKREIKILIEKTNRKELCNRLYIIKNMYRRIMDMAMSFYFTTGSVNMKAINLVIDTFVAEFESYDDIIKKKIDIDFRVTVKRLRSKEFLLNQSKNFKMLNYVSSK